MNSRFNVTILNKTNKPRASAGLYIDDEAGVDEGNRRRPRAQLNNNAATAMAKVLCMVIEP